MPDSTIAAPGTLHAAAAQFDSIPGDLDANCARHLALIAQARERHLDLLVFPELSLVGHGAGRHAPELGLEPGHALIQSLADAAGPVRTVFGFVETDAAGQYYNSVATVGDGRLLHVHRKVNLATYGRLDDGKYYARGGLPRAFTLDSRWSLATPICADLWNPALVHELACQGANVMAAPISSGLEAVGTGFDNPAGWAVNLQFHAMTYGCYLVMANRTDTEDGLTFWGGSRIVDPFGQVIAQAGNTATQLVCARLDHDTLRRARFLLPTVRDARDSGWGSRLGRDPSMPL
ncbi:nitrilase-related carbon-nitrogen hydrolase [Bordetella sp. BOR01]|uniref:nitrilase-related carbon-nitrogen hydrolase n=1 Tax=Bordetella sp. BOR01 TaxID=2854779 RepID=UPI001C466D4A|nr:nitrilase-related carbon-nitrogen hydrolase [Bordetella sp. BOR01]MBV7486551.1 nitrilase [Bordetella sp. BOR01]